jgi:hypothetical protein
LLSAAGKFAWVNNDSSIGIFHVLHGALIETACFQFPQWILIRNPSELIETSSGTPAAAVDSMLERDVKRSAIDARLSTRNDFQALTVAAVYDRRGRAGFISVAGRNNVRALDHQDHCSLRCAWAMAHAFGNNKALPRAQIDNTIFKVDEEISIENEKEFINVLVLMPVVLTLHHCHPNDGVVDLAKRLIVPLVRAGIGQFLHIDQLEWSVENVEVSLIWKILERFV